MATAKKTVSKKETAKKKMVQGRVIVTAHYPRQQESQDEKQLEVLAFESEPASVQACVGHTINMGNYNSARVEARVTLPCYPEEVTECFKRAWDIALKESDAQYQEAIAFRDGK